MVPAGGIERYAPTDNTQLIEKVRTQEPLNPLYARLLCTKSCTRNRSLRRCASTHHFRWFAGEALVFVSISILRALVVTVCDAYGLGSNHRAKPIDSPPAHPGASAP